MYKIISIIFLYLISCFCVAQNVGIGTQNPKARLHVVDSNVLFSANWAYPANPADPPATGIGKRMMWYADKGAFRAGGVTGQQWDKDNIGNNSFASGTGTTASGIVSAAFGQHTIASGIAAFAMGTTAKATGFSSLAGGSYTHADGWGAVALGDSSVAMGDYSVAIGYRPKALGNFSIAMGYRSEALDAGSIAMGTHTKANTYYSQAIGFTATTTGFYSTSIGTYNTASGNYSTAMGVFNTSRAFGGFTAGMYNDSIAGSNPNIYIATDPLFTIGNGTSSGTRSNAIMVLKNARTGIGTSKPAARLHVADSSVVFTAEGEAPETPNPVPITGNGRRMMWYADKGAFRVGFGFGARWAEHSIGNYSVAGGYKSWALGFGAIAFGTDAEARANNTIALGYSAHATNNYATAMGYLTSAEGFRSNAIGTQVKAFGSETFAAGDSSFASGNSSTALGHGTFSKAFGSFAIGSFNDSINSSNRLVPISGDPLFIIGNGTAHHLRSNAMVILKNGNVGIGTNTPTAKLHISGGSVVAAISGTAPGNPANPPVSGVGRRMIWYADKAAFRSGYVSGSQWDNANVGLYSIAGGFDAKATGYASTAFGTVVESTGNYSVALGRRVGANGIGSFIFGDSDPNNKGLRTSISDNLFWSRFNGGYYLVSSDAGADIGVRVLAGGNSWTTISDQNLKENFEPVDGEALLQKLSGIPQYTWNYKGQDPKNFRHYGPMAQDFYEAFGKDEYGTIGCDTLINQHDFIGVNMVAIQALEKRTSELQKELQSALSQLNEAMQLINNQQKDLEVLKKEQLKNSKSSPKYMD